MRSFRFPLLFVVLSTQLQVQAEMASPYASPLAIRVGKSTVVTFSGEKFGGAAGFWSSFPAKAVRVSGSDDHCDYRLTIGRDVTVGVGAIRLATADGISRLRLLMIDDLPSVSVNGENRSIDRAQKLSFPVAVDGTAPESAAHYFKLEVKRDQRISVEVVAQRLGSRMDPMVRLLDADSKELAYSDDSTGTGADCRFAFKFPQSGAYVLEVRDINYEGGAEYHYRLRVGDFPLPMTTFPLGARRGTDATIKLIGPGCEKLAPLAVTVPPTSERMTLNVRSKPRRGTGFISLAAGDLPEQAEVEPNDTFETATKVVVPGIINGQFAKAHDPDYFEFDAKSGERMVFRGRARSLGSPCDLLLEVRRADNVRIAESKPGEPDEAVVEATFPADGEYRLRVEDIARRGGAMLGYRIEAERGGLRFLLGIDDESFNVAPGHPLRIRINAAREGYKGPIGLFLKGDLASFDVKNGSIPAGKDDAVIEVEMPEGVSTGRLMHFSVFGKATIDGDEVVRRVSTSSALKKLFPRLIYPPAEMDGMIGLGISDTAPESVAKPAAVVKKKKE